LLLKLLLQTGQTLANDIIDLVRLLFQIHGDLREGALNRAITCGCARVLQEIAIFSV
jgi:hypothetical protein